MVKTITIANYNRPDCFKRCVEALRNQQGCDLDEWHIHVGIDGGGGKENELMEVFNSIDFCNKSFRVAGVNIGINANTFWCMKEVFRCSAMNVYLEDDIVLSPDALSLADWFYSRRGKYSALSLCNINQKVSEDLDGLYETDAFIGWGFVMGRGSWLKYAKEIWLRGESMWDNKVANNMRELGGKNLIPFKSRATNIGNEGVHFKKDFYDKFMKGHTYLKEYKKCNFQIKK